eukprot:2772072-Prymnesium_polylepis.1
MRLGLPLGPLWSSAASRPTLCARPPQPQLATCGAVLAAALLAPFWHTSAYAVKARARGAASLFSVVDGNRSGACGLERGVLARAVGQLQAHIDPRPVETRAMRVRRRRLAETAAALEARHRLSFGGPDWSSMGI